VTEWLLLSANSAIVQLYYGENKLILNEIMMVRSALFLINTLSLICIVLAHWNNSLRVDMSLHSDTLFWSRVNQSLLLLLNAEYLAEKQQIPILLSLVSPDWDSNSRSTEHETSTLTITPPMQSMVNINRESLQCRNLQNVKKSV
jgi:hypothetical protein